MSKSDLTPGLRLALTMLGDYTDHLRKPGGVQHAYGQMVQSLRWALCPDCGEMGSIPGDQRFSEPCTHPRVEELASPPPMVDMPDQTCEACSQEHPGAECAQDDLFGGVA